MADMPRKVKDVIVMLLAYHGVELRYLDTRKRTATVFVNVRFTYTAGGKRKRRRFNVSKATIVDLTWVSREASKLMGYDTGRDKLEFIQYVGKVLSKRIGEVKASEKDRIIAGLEAGNTKPAPLNLGSNNEKVH